MGGEALGPAAQSAGCHAEEFADDQHEASTLNFDTDFQAADLSLGVIDRRRYNDLLKAAQMVRRQHHQKWRDLTALRRGIQVGVELPQITTF